MTKDTKPSNSQNMDIGEDIAKTLSKATKLPVYYVDNKIPDGVAEIFINEAPELLNHMSKEDIYAEVHEVYMSIIMDSRGEEEQSQKIQAAAERFDQLLKTLRKGRQCLAYVFLPDIRGIPKGTQLGSARVVERSDIKFERDNTFWELADSYKQRYAHIDYDQSGTWLECKFNSFLSRNIRNDFFTYLQPIIGIVSILLHGHQISQQTLIGVVIHDKRQSFIGPDSIGNNYLTSGWAKYSDDKQDHLALVSNILSQKKASEIERKIILSSKLFNLRSETRSKEASFISTMSAIEGLLLTKSDRDYLGHKLSEKTAFLLRDKQNERIAMYDEMKRLYDLRSILVHGSSKTAEVTDRDIRTLENIYLALFDKVLDLSPKLKTASEFDKAINEKRFA